MKAFSCFSLAVVLLGVFGALQPASAQQTVNSGVINLAARVLPQDRTDHDAAHHSAYTNILTGQSGSKAAYNTQLAALGGAVFADDAGIYKTINSTDSRGVTDAAHQINHLGELTYVAPALGAVYLIGGKRNQDLAWRASIAVLKAGAVGVIVKELVGRKRPSGADGGGDGATFKPLSGSKDDYQSFPSGHTLVAFSVASVWASEKPKERVLAYGLASLVGAARIYSHAHWPSDVLWGAVLGISQGREAIKGDTNLLSLKF